jgi:hypothetical protein
MRRNAIDKYPSANWGGDVDYCSSFAAAAVKIADPPGESLCPL